MTTITAVALAIAVSITAPADELAGLWKAKRRFGPDARGTLVIRRAGATYTADMVGRIVPVRVENRELSFELPNGEGSFRGKLEKGTIAGHWFPPNSQAQNAGGKFASPVRLAPDGKDRWRGEVVPWEDAFTFYLLAQQQQDGSLSVFLRNPERDFGGQMGAERLTRDGNVVKLIGKRRSATGSYDPENDVLTLVFPNRGGSYDFRRERRLLDERERSARFACRRLRRWLLTRRRCSEQPTTWEGLRSRFLRGQIP